jgi:hypothetical protein
MMRSETRRHPWSTPVTTLNQRRGALIVLVVAVLLAAAITLALMRMDRAPTPNASPGALEELAILRAERADLERWPAESVNEVTAGW